MINYLDQLDKNILLFLNNLNNPYFDQVMWIITGRFVWIFSIIAFLIYFLRKGGWKETLLVLLVIAILITFCDQISSSLFKPIFERLRPSHQSELDPFLHIVNGYRGGKYGFISSHAANSIGFAMFSLLLFRNAWYTFVITIWAFLTSYSRIYLGVHFPGDILIGGLVGCLLGYLFYLLYRFIHERFYVQLGSKSVRSPYEIYPPILPIMIVAITILLIFVIPDSLYSLFKIH